MRQQVESVVLQKKRKERKEGEKEKRTKNKEREETSQTYLITLSNDLSPGVKMYRALRTKSDAG